ncbi:MAG: DNA mismatch repair endonuclease MutL [Ruminococcaceae bacterium]|nr:DNA mismatch repair endonuclease MutL [Oscillospiraceae bacterium]
MPKINLLSFEVANLIAAGEVVDRPASAIKEMIENSIDAEARHITVEIQNGGITFMRISDDGCGMEPEDIPLAVMRHATSKIKNAEDLDGICTLGFRGEALAAISAVSDVRIISKPHDATVGAEFEIHYGEAGEITERGCSNGTTIIVENLFANVPARRKFLKRDVTETTAVCANVERIALSHPEIAFRLICDGQVKLETAGDGKLISAIYAVFGRDFSNRLLEVKGEYDGITVKGYIGRSDNVKSNRNYENFYINKRYIKSRTASAAIEQAYTSYMPSEKFPVCVLFLSLNPNRVDVNVHPAKLEVKFSNEKPVFEAIYYAVKQTLEENTTRPEIVVQKTNAVRMSDAFAPVEREGSLKSRQISIDQLHSVVKNPQPTSQMTSKPIQSTVNTVKVEKAIPKAEEKIADETPKGKLEVPSVEQYIRENLMTTPEEKAAYDKAVKENPITAEQVRQMPGFIEFEKRIAEITGKVPTDEAVSQICEKPEKKPTVKNDQIEQTAVPENAPVIPSYRIIGEAFHSYIMVEVEEKVLIIDKHAAHERIVFEELKSNMYSAEVSSQLLMLPIEIMLMSDEVAAIEEYRREIEAVGFEFTSSRNMVFVNALPIGIEQEAVIDMFTVIADRIKNGTGSVDITRNIVFEKALYQASCKAAIKAGREYPEDYQKWVVEKLMRIPDITFCPHGRPVAMELSKRSIDRQFERT